MTIRKNRRAPINKIKKTHQSGAIKRKRKICAFELFSKDVHGHMNKSNKHKVNKNKSIPKAAKLWEKIPIEQKNQYEIRAHNSLDHEFQITVFDSHPTNHHNRVATDAPIEVAQTETLFIPSESSSIEPPTELVSAPVLPLFNTFSPYTIDFTPPSTDLTLFTTDSAPVIIGPTPSIIDPVPFITTDHAPSTTDFALFDTNPTPDYYQPSIGFFPDRYTVITDSAANFSDTFIPMNFDCYEY
ncbi:2282_t:CDS:1 [Acaulospora morrowiae]|uniref:2282_t:CDS:1 n=1 Tax=Acaulospora morrowiae TaxID=94023 RepID=A0A9N9DF44_9GLOM|nr:2282_t:CDS:1 [Acaulospora morrowiae]